MSTTALPPTVSIEANSKQILRGFHPGWFGAVLGTGIVGVAAYLNPGDQTGLLRAAHAIGVAVVILAWLVAVAIAVPYPYPSANFARSRVTSRMTAHV